MKRARSGCRLHKVIPFADLPKIKDEDGNEREVVATKAELMQFNIFEFDRGANKVQAICGGYLNNDTNEPEDGQGNPWPGEHICGGTGIYREKRLPLIAASLISYKGGDNGGRKRLMLDKRPEEFDRPDGDGGTIPAVVLNEMERLTKNLPRIMGDG